MNIGFIPLRAGSKGIPNKNIKLMNGKPLFQWVTEAALGSSLDKVFISTDSDDIMRSANKIKHPKLVIINRSHATATDIASTESAMLEFAENYSFKNIALIQATSPLLSTEDINQAFDLYFNEKSDSLLSCSKQKRFIWESTEKGNYPINYDYNNRPRRQDFDGFFVENGALYITSKDQLVKSKNRLSGKICIYEMHSDTYFEIDDDKDWIIVEQIMYKKLNDIID